MIAALAWLLFPLLSRDRAARPHLFTGRGSEGTEHLRLANAELHPWQ